MRGPYVVVSVLALALATGSCGGDDAYPPVHRYVSLGDSFTSGAGLAQPTSAGCQRSSLAYPTLVAKALGARLDDASCGSAATANVTAPQDVVGGHVPPQLDAVTGSADLVTVGLGFNDKGWYENFFFGCTALTASDPQGHPCKDHVDASGVDQKAVVATIGDSVEATLEAVEKKAPRAHVLLVGYPQLVPESGTCPQLPLAAGDYPFVRTMMELFDDALRDAARDAGATYVDVLSASKGHDICAGKEAWVNGVSTVPGVAVSYHPFAKEQRAVADLVVDAAR